jgi:hypothetical protein
MRVLHQRAMLEKQFQHVESKIININPNGLFTFRASTRDEFHEGMYFVGRANTFTRVSGFQSLEGYPKLVTRVFEEGAVAILSKFESCGYPCKC